jgi:sulfate transport system ATP-binding protein
VEGAKLRVGDDALPHDGQGLPHGTEVLAFARPHELRIVADPAAREGIEARVSRILTFGATARVELTGTANGSSEPHHYEVEITRPEAEGLQLGEGHVVRLVPSRLQVFEHPPGGSR